MEDVLDLYHEPYNPDVPLVCMDESPKQLIAETRRPLPPQPGKPACCDYEYERKGTAEIFMFCEPLAGKRWVRVSQRRTRKDWAEHIRWLLEEVYPDKPFIKLVMDNLNTHDTASLYEAFEPETARRLATRLDIHYTPKHGSWLNIAEIELKALTTQCLARRIATMDELTQEVQAWEQKRNTNACKVDWRFTTKDARIKLKSLYPLFQS
jgi:hypothetical protein